MGKSEKKLVIYGVMGALLLYLVMGNDVKPTFWKDQFLPAVQIRCLQDVSENEAGLEARQEFCTCVGKKFKEHWKTDQVFLTSLRATLPALWSSERSMRSRDLYHAVSLADADIDSFYRDLFGRLGLKWTGVRFQNGQDQLKKAIDDLYSGSKIPCVERGLKPVKR